MVSCSLDLRWTTSNKSISGLAGSVWCRKRSLSRADFEALVHPIFTFLNTTPHRVPLTDWYWMHDATKAGFQTRSVVGGVFLRLLSEPAMWKKWAGREKTKAAGWAGLPLER